MRESRAAAGLFRRCNNTEESQFLIFLPLKHGLQLVPQFRGIFVAMRGHGMLNRRIEHFLFLAGNFQCAVLLARIISAVDRLSHDANLCKPRASAKDEIAPVFVLLAYLRDPRQLPEANGGPRRQKFLRLHRSRPSQRKQRRCEANKRAQRNLAQLGSCSSSKATSRKRWVQGDPD